MYTNSLEEVQARLPELLARLQPGEELVITQEGQTVARLVKVSTTPPSLRKLGTMKGSVLHVAPDFDAPLDDFKEYME